MLLAESKKNHKPQTKTNKYTKNLLSQRDSRGNVGRHLPKALGPISICYRLRDERQLSPWRDEEAPERLFHTQDVRAEGGGMI